MTERRIHRLHFPQANRRLDTRCRARQASGQSRAAAPETPASVFVLLVVVLGVGVLHAGPTAGQVTARPTVEPTQPDPSPTDQLEPGQSLEQKLLEDLLACVEGRPVSAVWRHPRMIDGHLKGGGRSANHGRLTRAIQTCVAPDEHAGRDELTALQWWTQIEESERKSGHRYQEIGGGYEAWSGVAEAVVVWKTGNPDHPAARMLERELFLFAFAVRPIEHRSKWRPLYRGPGRRVAGLRKLPWSWSFNTDSLLYTKLLGLPIELDRLPRKTEVKIVDAVAARVGEILGPRLDLIRALATRPSTLVDRVDELDRRLADLRSVQPYLIVRHLPDDQVFSALLGPLEGRNTAPTRAVLARGAAMTATEIAYPFRRESEKARRRVRGREEIGAGGGVIEVARDGGFVYRAWNRSQESVESIQLPPWVAIRPDHQPCATAGIWLFPDRSPAVWVEPPCRAEREVERSAMP